jgi:hypothetical protein
VLAALGALAVLCQTDGLAARLVENGMVEVLFKCLNNAGHNTAESAAVKTKTLAALLATVENNVPAARIANCRVVDEDASDEDSSVRRLDDEASEGREESVLPHLEAAFSSGSAEHVTMALKLLLHVHPYCSADQLQSVRDVVQDQLNSRHWVREALSGASTLLCGGLLMISMLADPSHPRCHVPDRGLSLVGRQSTCALI